MECGLAGGQDDWSYRMRVVIVSDRRLSSEALANALGHIPDTLVVAEVGSLAAAYGYCQTGEADAVMADAAIVSTDVARVGPFPHGGGIAGAIQHADSDRTDRTENQSGRPWQLAARQLHVLSSREREVFTLLGLGYSNRRIAQHLAVTERTVKAHVGRVLAKLGLESRLEAGLAALICVSGHPVASSITVSDSLNTLAMGNAPR